MQANIQRNQLFLASCIALIATAMTFAFRASLEGVWGEQFQLTKEELGWIFSPAFWGFTLAMIFGGPLCDLIGMKRLLLLAFLGHFTGIVLYLFAGSAMMLFVGTLCIGIGNGMVEAACNPLVVALYPEKKTTMLNRFHVWFPGGIVIGGLLAYFLSAGISIDWKWLMALLFIPVLIYGYIFWNLKFPPTERVAKGVSTKTMFLSCLNPLFLAMLCCMMLTSATELGTNQWLGALLQGAGISGILILVLINGIMAVGRSLAGNIVHKLKPAGMLIFSMIFTSLGLYLLSSTSGVITILAAVVFAIGLCFVWPTMLGFVAENIPQTGALGLSLMGGGGMLSVAFIVPMMGKWYDQFKNQAALSGADAAELDAIAGSQTLLKVTIMPLAVLVILLVIVIRNKRFIMPDQKQAK